MWTEDAETVIGIAASTPTSFWYCVPFGAPQFEPDTLPPKPSVPEVPLKNGFCVVGSRPHP
ncbi:MAG TPA: hypothetical protein VMH78_07520 [Thermoplasmata archaeon]|nr:hypothetical protein [Thermoplasmata archaeon]